MSNADIRHAVDQSLQPFQQVCQGFLRTDPSAHPLLPDPCLPIVLLALVSALVCTLLGYLTFLVLVHKEESAEAKAMQYEARSDTQTNGLHREDPANLTKPPAAVEERQRLHPVEYEAVETSEQRTPPQQTAAPPTPVPGTPNVNSQPPAKSGSDSEENRQPSKLATLKSVLSAVRPPRPAIVPIRSAEYLGNKVFVSYYHVRS